MSKILYVCSRNKTFTKDIENKLTKICGELVPDNVRKPPKHKICVKGHVAYAVTMNSNTLHENDLSLLLGVLYEREDINWDKPKSRYPDGNYALFRNDQHEIEVVSDAAGSRTLWFYSDDELLSPQPPNEQ